MTNPWVWSGKWKVTITPIGGSPSTFQSGDGILSKIGLVLQSRGMSSFEFSLINDGGVYNSLFEIGDTVEIWLDPDNGVLGTTKRLKGFIKKPGYGRKGVNNTHTLKGFSYTDKFKRTIVPMLYKGSRTYDDIIKNATDGLLAKYASEVSGSGVQAMKNLGANETLKFDYVDLFECLDRIRNFQGDWVFDVTPALVLNFKERKELDTTKVIEDFDDVYFEYDDDKLVNRVYVFGGRDYALQSKTSWSGTASLNNVDAPLAYNDVLTTGWDSGQAQASGNWYKLDLGATTIIGRMYIDNSQFGATKYARNFKVEASKDNTNWTLITTVSGNTLRDILFDFPQDEFRYIKITITATDTNNFAIGEIYFYSYYNLLSKAEDAASIAKYGVYERVIRDSTITTKAQAQARARTEIATNKDPVIAGEVTLAYFLDVSPNELVSINVPGTPINQKLAVQRVSYSEDTKGSFEERISLRSV